MALNKAWDEIKKLSGSSRFIVQFLTDTYEVNVNDRTILSQPSLLPAEDYLPVLILHYLLGIKKYGFKIDGKWISFNKTFWPAFHESAIKPLLDYFHQDPDGLIKDLVERLGGNMVQGGDVAVEVATFPEIFVRMIFWKGDEDLPAEVAILFDRGLARIYSMEDVAALLEIMLRKINR